MMADEYIYEVLGDENVCNNAVGHPLIAVSQATWLCHSILLACRAVDVVTFSEATCHAGARLKASEEGRADKHDSFHVVADANCSVAKLIMQSLCLLTFSQAMRSRKRCF